MYSVSESYRAKMLDQVQTHRLRGTIGGVDFTEADVIGVSYTNQCADKNVNLGSVNIGTLKLTFLTDILNRGEYQGKTVTLYDSLFLGIEDDEEVWEEVPIGVFYISEATWNAAGVDIVAYDCLSKLDKKINIEQTSSKLFGFCQYIAQETGTTFGMTEAECDVLPNGTEIIAPYEEANFETFRDMLSSLAQIIGGFAYAAKNGTWKLRAFDDDALFEIPKNRRMSGSSFSDYKTLYDTVMFTDAQAKMTRVVGEGEGLTMNLGTQAFLQLGTYEAKMRRARTIASSISRMNYIPFKASMLPAMICLDLGDVISLVDDHSGDTSTGAIMSMTWTYNKSISVQCYGDNPNLRNGQGKTEKDISGILNQTVQNEVTYYTYTNLDSITIEDETETTIASLAFTAAQTTTVKILHEFILEMARSLGIAGSYEIRYYLDEELVSYKPYESLSPILASVDIPVPPTSPEEEETETIDVDIQDVNFAITKDFFYVIRDVAPNQRHTWQVRILTHGINQTIINPNNAHIVLEGQRLYGDEYFDGTVDVREDFYVVPIGNIGVVSELEEEPMVDIRNFMRVEASDEFESIKISGIGLITMNDAINIYMTRLSLADESHSSILTEDGLLIRAD